MNETITYSRIILAGIKNIPVQGKYVADNLPVIIILVTFIVAIVILSLFVVYYRRRLNSTRESLVRYINIYLQVKDFVPVDERPVVNRMKDPVTPDEFIQIINRMLKRMMLLPLFLLLVLPLSAQSQTEEADSVYEFRFVPKRNSFFVPYKNNLSELKRLSLFVEQYRQEITDGRLPLYVDGYCNSTSDEAENLAIARLRSNRVKSELISRDGMREEYFITRNHAEGGDYVRVRIRLPKAQPTRITEPTAEREEKEVKAVAEPVAENRQTESAVTVSENAAPQIEDKAKAAPYTFALRANLLRWATLTPDLGIEWRINRIGILVNDSWTSWSWDNKNRRYALWEVAPEIRYYIGKEKRGFIGAIYKVGEFNYKFSTVGKQGDLTGGGITGGYQWKLNRALALDFHLGIGCIHADYDKYEVIDGVRVRCGNGSKNWWGPVSAGVTLIWKLF